MIIIPEVINTMLMGLIFMVIVITIVRPLMLNMVHEYSGPNVQDAIIDEIELEVARLAEQHSQRNSALIEFHRQLLIAPPRPERKSSEPSVAHDDDNDVDLFGLRAELDQAKAQAEQARLEAEEKARLEEELKQQEAAALAEQMAQLEGDAAQSGDGAMGEIEIREGESLAEIKERMKREQQSAKKPTIPPELLNNAKSYEDKVGVVRMVVQQDQNRVAAVIRGMIKIK